LYIQYLERLDSVKTTKTDAVAGKPARSLRKKCMFLKNHMPQHNHPIEDMTYIITYEEQGSNKE